jgi:Holliday junction resolvase
MSVLPGVGSGQERELLSSVKKLGAYVLRSSGNHVGQHLE